MKRFLINFLLFSVYGLVFYILLNVAFGTFVPQRFKKNLNYKLGGNGFLYSRLKEADTTKNVDVLFLGSSHAYRGYDSRLFAKQGLKTFNLGSSSQSPLITEVFVERYLNQLNPKLVIFDIYPRVFESDGVESTLDVVANSKINKGIFELAFEVNNIKVYNTLIYSYFKQKIKPITYKEEPHRIPDTYIAGGYVESYKKYLPKKTIVPGKYEISDKQMDAFVRIVDLLKAKKIPYVLVQSPISKKLYSSIKNNHQVDEICSKYGKYYNFNETMNLPDSVFFDDNHLNQLGVNQFNQKLIETLKLGRVTNQTIRQTVSIQ